VPWAGCHGTLDHAARGVLETVSDPEKLLRKDSSGPFRVGDLSLSLGDPDVSRVQSTDDKLPHPGLDFVVGDDVTVRVSFLERSHGKRLMRGHVRRRGQAASCRS
jgi:hypothetical protein